MLLLAGRGGREEGGEGTGREGEMENVKNATELNAEIKQTRVIHFKFPSSTWDECVCAHSLVSSLIRKRPTIEQHDPTGSYETDRGVRPRGTMKRYDKVMIHVWYYLNFRF